MVRYMDLARELKKAVEHETYSDTNCSLYTWNNPKRPGETVRERKNRVHPDHSTVKISLEHFWRPEESCCYSDVSEKPPIITGAKIHTEYNNNNNNNNNKHFWYTSNILRSKQIFESQPDDQTFL